MTGPRIASFPDRHPYVDAVRPDGVVPVRAAADEDDQWAPHPWWAPARLARHADEVDLLHVHFGYDHLTPGQLRDWVAQVRRCGLGLVVTVHDLRNPHHATAQRHDAHLATLLDAAHEVLTLTSGAARVITQRWGRSAYVVPHPSLLVPGPLPVLPAGEPLAGLHLKSLRRNLLDPDRLVAAASAGARNVGGRLVVDVHPDAVDRPELAGVRRLARRGDIRLRVHERYGDAALVRYLHALDASVLPHRFGTHSGWLELCRDIGTRVVAPDCGYFAEQWPAVYSYRNSEATGLDEGSLRAAVSAALTAPRLAPADPVRRRAELAEVRRTHAGIYRSALACSVGR